MYYTYYDFANDMDIANESLTSLLKNIKDRLKEMILKFLRFVEGKLKKAKDSKIRNALLKAIKKLRGLLGDTDKITADNITTKPNEIQKEFEEVKEEVITAVGIDDPEVNDIDTDPSREPGAFDNNIKINRRSRTGKCTYYYHATITNEEYFKTLVDECTKADNATTFAEYIPHFKNFKKMLRLPDKCTVYGVEIDYDQNVNLTYILENNRAQKRSINKPLYHTSENPDLTEITPRWRAERNNNVPFRGRWFDAPRAYFGIYPMDRMGYKVDSPDDGRYVYMTNKIRTAYIDNDGMDFGTSVYVEQDASIPLIKVDNYFDK